MQCPNCRKIEKGRWLYASGHRPSADIDMGGWATSDNYDITSDLVSAHLRAFLGHTSVNIIFLLFLHHEKSYLLVCNLYVIGTRVSVTMLL
jgi:endogenous inhibitor of DNA gyrase (YacG/DUF329 family)